MKCALAVTMRSQSDRAGITLYCMRVHRWSLLIVWLIAASISASGAVHASEFPSPTMIECSGYVHTDGDADESQGDSDRAAPHHHGNCHGAASVVPAKAVFSVTADLQIDRKFEVKSKARERWTTGPVLRPPIA